MRSSVNLAAALLVGACSGGTTLPPAPTGTATVAADSQVPLPPEANDATGPRGTSGTHDAAHYDEVGYATWYGEEAGGNATASGAPFDPNGITAAHRTLPLGSYAEVTALATGRTILVLINDRGPQPEDRLIDLSRGAAALLGTGADPMAPVRVRSTVPSPADVTALAAGRAATARLDAPPAILAALRRRLPDRRDPIVAPVSPPPRPTAAPSPKQTVRPVEPAPSANVRYTVQVAAFSTEARARALAKPLGGSVQPTGGVYRVRLGPFADAAAAARARDGAAKRGYGDARIIAQTRNPAE